MCDTVARCEHVSRDQDTPSSFVTTAATHPRQPATVPSGEYIFVGRTFSLAKISRLAQWKIFPHLKSRSDLILLLLGSGVHLGGDGWGRGDIGLKNVPKK